MHSLNEYWTQIRKLAYELLRSYNPKDGLFSFEQQKFVSNNTDIHSESKLILIALEYCLVHNYCNLVKQGPHPGNVFKITDKGMNFIFDYYIKDPHVNIKTNGA